MSHRTLREIAKFGAGLVAADLLTFLWLWSSNMFPLQTWGVTWTSDILLPATMFDVALLIILVHYGWHLGKIPRPKERSYLFVIGVILTVIAVAHLLRVFTGSSVVVVGWSVPLWLSWVGTAVAAYLAYASFYFAARSR
jgi:hypothetical protein